MQRKWISLGLLAPAWAVLAACAEVDRPITLNEPARDGGVDADADADATPSAGDVLCGALEAQPEVFREEDVYSLAGDSEYLYMARGNDIAWVSKFTNETGVFAENIHAEAMRVMGEFVVIISIGYIEIRPKKNSIFPGYNSYRFHATKQPDGDFIRQGNETSFLWTSISDLGNDGELRAIPLTVDGGFVSGSFIHEEDAELVGTSLYPVRRLIAAGSNVYLAADDLSAGGVYRLGLPQGSPQQLSKKPALALETDGLSIFWLDNGGDLWRLRRSDSTLDKIASGLDAGRELSLSGGCFYMVSGSDLQRLPREGGVPTTIAKGAAANLWRGNLVSDSTHLYWASNGKVWRVALAE